ncbi:MAG: autotransporter-associated beta strand repeat-containing protein, partial [Pseudolabrys sp.]
MAFAMVVSSAALADDITVTGATSIGTISGTGPFNILGTSASATTDVLTVNGPNSYPDATFIGDATTAHAVTVVGGGTNTISANSPTTVTLYSILNLGGFNQSIGSLAGAGTVTNNGSNAALTEGGDNSSTTFSGVIENGTGTTALVKVGSGTTILSGANTYTGGTTVSAGSLTLS